MTKVMPWPWLSISKQIWIRSFKWGTVCSCRSRGCKTIRGQSLRSKKICQISQALGASVSNLAESAIFYQPPTLTSDIFAASWRTRTYSTSFERSDSYLFGDWKPKVIVWLLTWFIFAQSTLISYHTEAFFKTEVDCTVLHQMSMNVNHR